MGNDVPECHNPAVPHPLIDEIIGRLAFSGSHALTSVAPLTPSSGMNAWIELLKRSPLPRWGFLLQNAYLRMRKPRSLGVRTLVLDSQGQVLLVRHSYRPGWFLPGGGVHKWETLEEAAIREAREEGAVEIDSLEPLFGVYANFTPYRCDHVALFVTRRWRPVEFRSAEIAEIGFYPSGSLPTGTTDATRRRIAEVLDGETKAPHW